jgi:transposase
VRYKRWRKCLKAKQDPEQVASKQECLLEIEHLEQQGHIDVFYGDESGFWYSPVQVEGWKRVPFTTQTTSKMTTKKTYSKEFKEEAVRLAEQHGNQSQTARDLGLQLSVLRRWIKEFNQDGEKAFPGKGHSKEEELRQLQRENQRLKETVEILKSQ